MKGNVGYRQTKPDLSNWLKSLLRQSEMEYDNSSEMFKSSSKKLT